MNNKIVFIYDECNDISIDYGNVIISLEYTNDFCELNTDITITI